MEKRVIKASALNKRAKNAKLAETLNTLASNYSCSVETDHNDNLVLRGAEENIPKAVALLETMNNYTSKGVFTFENGVQYVVLGRLTTPKDKDEKVA